MRLLILSLLLAGCATVPAPSVAEQHAHSPDHHAPPKEVIASRTSLRREAIILAEVAYGAASIATELALDNKRLSRQDRDELPAIAARADAALEDIRRHEKADEVTFLAALYYLRFSINDLTLRAEKGIAQ